MQDELKKILAWADSKIAAGEEPPWAWYQYMKLKEATEAILKGMESAASSQPSAVSSKENSRQSEQRSETHLQLVASTDRRDTVPHRPFRREIPLPT